MQQHLDRAHFSVSYSEPLPLAYINLTTIYTFCCPGYAVFKSASIKTELKRPQFLGLKFRSFSIKPP